MLKMETPSIMRFKWKIPESTECGHSGRAGNDNSYRENVKSEKRRKKYQELNWLYLIERFFCKQAVW